MLNGDQRIQRSMRSARLLPSTVQTFWLTLVVFELLSLIIASYFRFARHLDYYPLGNPIFFRRNANSDLMCAAAQFAHFRQASFWSSQWVPLVYPAPVGLVYEALFRLSRHPEIVFRLVLLIAIAGAGWLFVKALVRRGIGVQTACAFTFCVLLTSYPFQLIGWLLNLEAAVWIVLALGLWAYVHERPWLAAACFGIAGSMKIFPLVYLGLFLSAKRYREMLWGISACCLTWVLSTLLLGPTFHLALQGQRHGLQSFLHLYVLYFNRGDNGINHSIFGFIKLLLWKAQALDHLAAVYRVYVPVAGFSGLLIYFFRIRHLPRLNQILFFSIFSVLVPPVSHDYTLVHLYAPLAMLLLLCVDRRSEPLQGMGAALTCFAVLCTSRVYMRLNGVVIDGQLKAVVLAALLLIALLHPWPEQDALTSSGLPRYSPERQRAEGNS